MDNQSVTPFESPREKFAQDINNDESNDYKIDNIMRRRKIVNIRNRQSESVKNILYDTREEVEVPARSGRRIVKRISQDSSNERPHGLRLRFAYVDGHHSAQAEGTGNRDVPAGQLLGCDDPKNPESLTIYALDSSKPNLEGPTDKLKPYASTDDLDCVYRPSIRTSDVVPNTVKSSAHNVKNVPRKRIHVVDGVTKLIPNIEREIVVKPSKKYIPGVYNEELIKDRGYLSGEGLERSITASTDIVDDSIYSGEEMAPNSINKVCDFNEYEGREEQALRDNHMQCMN